MYWEARSATPAKCLIEKEIKRAQKNKIFFNFNQYFNGSCRRCLKSHRFSYPTPNYSKKKLILFLLLLIFHISLSLFSYSISLHRI